ncbi:hypothetical protein CHELA1G11_14612 [Hyphomicrobiales bacterium]|nr:hypothetical protein CHELA1G2_14495 [Hyphomicrobiales bacterium]CAH1679818.1 hypothetical protein CHELA1G11_14612 [Hyphomicrobiales bacterium]
MPGTWHFARSNVNWKKGQCNGGKSWRRLQVLRRLIDSAATAMTLPVQNKISCGIGRNFAIFCEISHAGFSTKVRYNLPIRGILSLLSFYFCIYKPCALGSPPVSVALPPKRVGASTMTSRKRSLRLPIAWAKR